MALHWSNRRDEARQRIKEDAHRERAEEQRAAEDARAQAEAERKQEAVEEQAGEEANSPGSPVAQSCAQVGKAESEHAAGPWGVRSLDMTDYAVVGPERKVCNVAFYSKPENKANARLISAAPDLLQAARQAEEALHHMISANGMEPHEHDCYTDLKAAIAKAEGEA